MKHRYVVLGAGRQGVAVAYDFLQHGDAREVVLVDSLDPQLRGAVNKLETLCGKGRVVGRVADCSQESGIVPLLQPGDIVHSALPHFFNLGATRAAIAAKAAGFTDLGGNTDVVRAELALSDEARKSGTRIVPDCGLAPGLNQTLSVYAMQALDEPLEVRSFCGGLPQEPKGPLLYSILFSIHGLIGEYTGTAYYLRNGKVTGVPAFTELEPVDTAIGRLDAFVTTGGTSTAPWTFEGKLQSYEYKTLRYPGHYERMRAIIELGLTAKEKVRIGDQEVSPYEVFCATAGKKLDHGRVKDVVIQRVIARGKKNAVAAQVVIDLVDRYDDPTDFSAMERTTGFSAAIVCEMMARGETPIGAVSLETAVDANKFVDEFKRRGFDLRMSGP